MSHRFVYSVAMFLICFCIHQCVSTSSETLDKSTGLASEENYKDFAEANDTALPHQRLKRNLKLKRYRLWRKHAMIFLQHHKFLESYQEGHGWAGRGRVGMYSAQFPKLTEFEDTEAMEDLHDECAISHTRCLRTIYDYSQPVVQELLRMDSIPFRPNYFVTVTYQPFNSRQQLFEFRTAASMYMCYYTMMKESGLEDLWGIRDCGEYLGFNDFRNTKDDPFLCSFLSFCPDPCCGENGPAKNEHMCESINPCRSEDTQSGCGIRFEDNQDLNDMFKGNFNYTCSCDHKSPKNGFEWDNELHKCMEKCYGGCEDPLQCTKTIHGYRCMCRPGYYLEPETNTCKMKEVEAVIDKYMKKKLEKEAKKKAKEAKKKAKQAAKQAAKEAKKKAKMEAKQRH